MRYVSKGNYVTDTDTGMLVAKAHVMKGSNLIQDAENDDNAKVFASIMAAALNEYNSKQGGL